VEPDAPANDRLTDREAAFIAARDGFYMATVSETGWPYVQHRGGPAGFLKVIDDRTVGFADYRGNRQYVSVGNLRTADRVSLILMDYPNRRRLKLIGHARAIDAVSDPALLVKLQDVYAAKVERGIVIRVAGFDWNCPQHITPRFSEAEIAEVLAPVRERMEALEAENAALRAQLAR
jgi:predicted pyridoxine 5'-phosphate oxidase superfamily flavin-nucleotide-binding protein